ncbi:MAG: endo-1,4-beta-xylanase [Pirellulales bacterium]|nr:endo-1,4-beta-xylanase [Pirellulales bacterium]
MAHNWNRREVLQSLSLGVVAGNHLMAATVKESVAAPLARCTVFNYRGEPLGVKEFDRFHTCDLLLRPFTFQPRFEPGIAAFQPPERPFRIALPLAVPGFGEVFVYADNRGRGYTAKSFSEKPLMLNYEFAADRLATVRALSEECRRSGITISAAALERMEKAKALLDRAESEAKDRPAFVRTLMSSLCESLWAGEMMVTQRAEQNIARNGPRPGFLFGCNAFGYGRHGKLYAERFEAIFNFATLPFYRGGVERVQGHPNYGHAESILESLLHTQIVPKGHPLIFLVPEATPDWLRKRSFQETRQLCLQHVREAILKFRNRIHIWDVVNEPHVQPDIGPNSPEMHGFDKEKNVELTVAALKTARQADPTCFRLVNSTGTWSDYYMSRQPAPWQQSPYDFLQKLKNTGAEYEAVGLQYYHSGRDMLEFERNLETFKTFGKPIHITELGISSKTENVDPSKMWGGGDGGAAFVWRGERFTEEIQAQWVEAVYKIAFSKPYVDAITWWDFIDPGFPLNAGLLTADCTPKPSYHRLLALLTKWKKEGILDSVGGHAGADG